MKRFWDKVDKTGDCWEWLAGKDKDGYGRFKPTGGKEDKSHRYALRLEGVDIPPEMQVCHACDNPSCVNPNHLWLGTHKDNHRDKQLKGRAPRGEKTNTAKLTEEDVIWIRQLGASAKELAKCFGVTEATIHHIRRRHTWRHI